MTERRRGRRWMPLGIGLALLGTVFATVIRSRSAPRVPAAATEAQLVAFVEGQRKAILAAPKLGAGGDVGPVIELPERVQVRFLAPPRAVAWWSRGGRFSPGGTLTMPNAQVPFLFPAQENGGGRARFALMSPPMRGIVPVPNTVDLPPVVVTRGEDRTVWTGTLPKVGGRYALPESIGVRGLAIADDGFPAPRVGVSAPLTLRRGELPPNGVLLGRSLLFRLRRPERVLRGSIHPLNILLLRAGIRPFLPLPSETLMGTEMRYEVRTTAHVYRTQGEVWRYSHTRTMTDTAVTMEGENAAALAKLGLKPVPKFSGPSQDEPFDRGVRPGESFIPYR